MNRDDNAPVVVSLAFTAWIIAFAAASAGAAWVGWHGYPTDSPDRSAICYACERTGDLTDSCVELPGG